MRRILILVLQISSFCVLFSTPIPYAGKVSVNGVNFDGQAQFSFSILLPSGFVVWQQGAEANATISVPVENGRYLVLLGGQGMNSLPPALFLEHDNVSLRVRADLSDGEGLRIVGPDQPITSTPHALSAEVARRALVADGVASGTVTHEMLSQSVKQDLNRTVTKSMLGSDVLSDLNRTVTPQMIQSSSITTAQLNEQILKYLKPEITYSPQAPGLIFGGQTVTLLSQAEGKYLSYQWYKNGQPIAGATGDRYVIEDVNGTLHDGNYSLVVSNDFGTVTTQPTQLVVDGTPTSHTVASISMDMIFCPPGTFTMGSPANEAGRGSDETQHQVTLTNGFYLGKYEVTQAQYETVMTGNSEGLNAKPSNWPNNNDRPVEQVSWNDIQVFLSRLNDMEQTAGRLPAGWKYVLPTEAQWEYACRAGTTTAYSWGNDINSTRAN
ncbi:MAG: hypothetical protein CMI19_04440, partial [Opitutae bacterium]|nr:hypothetical protein [Opitutae bacterium]